MLVFNYDGFVANFTPLHTHANLLLSFISFTIHRSLLKNVADRDSSCQSDRTVRCGVLMGLILRGTFLRNLLYRSWALLCCSGPVCVCVCMYVCMCVFMFVCMYVCICVYVHKFVYICNHAYMYGCMHVCVCMYACMYVCMYLWSGFLRFYNPHSARMYPVVKV